MKNKMSLLVFTAGVLLFAAGCSTDDMDSMATGTFEIAEDALKYDFTQAQEIVFIPVRTNIPQGEWKISSSDDSWCKISKSYDNRTGLMLAVTESEEPEVRNATAKVTAGGREYTIHVRQLGTGLRFSFQTNLSEPPVGMSNCRLRPISNSMWALRPSRRGTMRDGSNAFRLLRCGLSPRAATGISCRPILCLLHVRRRSP